MPTEASTILWSIVWAVAVVGSALVFGASNTGYWMECGLLVGALGFVILKRQPVCRA